MKLIVDAMGDTCPIPVVKTKEAIKKLNGAAGEVETYVDNEISVQNLTKMAQQKGYGIVSEKLEENKFRTVMTIGAVEDTTSDEQAAVEDTPCIPDARDNVVVVIASNQMGQGDEKLGTALMKAFVYALSTQDKLPKTILFYNSGAYLTCEDSPVLEDLKSLEAQGVEIMTCGTCLNHYGLTEKLAIGEVTNMYVIVEKQMNASNIVKP